MYCPKCGTQNKDISNFCVSCGTNLENERIIAPSPAPVRSTGSTPASGWICKHCGNRNPDWNSVCNSCGKHENDVLSPEYTRNWMTDLLFSPLFLILTIAFSLQLLLNIQQVMDSSSAISDSLESAFSALDIPTSAVDVILEPLTEAENKAQNLQLLAYIPNILVVVGMWMLYIHASMDRADATGAKLMHTGYVIQTTVAEILLIISAFLLLIAYTKIPSESWYDTLRDALGSALIILLIVIAVVSAYFAKLLSTVKSIENTLENGIPDIGLSRTIAVLCLIFGSLQGLSVLQGDWSLLTIVSATAQILTGVAIFAGRSSLEELSYERVRAIRTDKGSTSKSVPSANSSSGSNALWRCRECGSTNVAGNTVCMICGVARPSGSSH